MVKQASVLALKEAGAEVVAFDMDGEPSEMASALHGVHGLFVITNFWEHFDYEREIDQVKNVIKAGEMVGVQHYVWSTLEDTRPFFDSLEENERPPKIKGTYVPHFDGKGNANDLFPKVKTTILYTSFYLENLYQFGMVNNGVFTTNMANVELPVIAVNDIGNCTYVIFKNGSKYMGSEVHLAGERITPTDLMAKATKVTGLEYSYKAIDRDAYAGLGFPGADDLANMFDYFLQNPKYREALDPTEARALYPGLASVEDFFESHKKEILSVGPQA